MYFKANLEDNWEGGYYKAKGRVRYDARYDGNNPYSERARDKYRFDADWRHLYVGHSLGDGEVTVGWQQVVWGRADELRVLDQINPLDYRDGLTPLLEDSRIAVPMVRFAQPVGEWELEALWITDFVKTRRRLRAVNLPRHCLLRRTRSISCSIPSPAMTATKAIPMV